MKKLCNGCHFIDCPWKAYKKECPCTTCLVKVTCGSPCEEFYQFRGKYEEQHRRQLQETWI